MKLNFSEVGEQMQIIILPLSNKTTHHKSVTVLLESIDVLSQYWWLNYKVFGKQGLAI